MALIQCSFFSKVLGMTADINLILPEPDTFYPLEELKKKRKFQVLYLLHGFSDNHSDWFRRSSIERYAAEYQTAVVMPAAGKSFYTDMAYGDRYWTYITEELPEFICSHFPISEERKDNFVAGLSMGGYGAFKWALRKPQQFNAAVSLSGALDIVPLTKEKVKDLDGTVLEEFMQPPFSLIFGEKPVENSENDLLYLLEKEKGKDLPRLYAFCGTEDFLLYGNRKFVKKAHENGIQVEYQEGHGTHDWPYWDPMIERAMGLLGFEKKMY